MGSFLGPPGSEPLPGFDQIPIPDYKTQGQQTAAGLQESNWWDDLIRKWHELHTAGHGVVMSTIEALGEGIVGGIASTINGLLTSDNKVFRTLLAGSLSEALDVTVDPEKLQYAGAGGKSGGSLAPLGAVLLNRFTELMGGQALEKGAPGQNALDNLTGWVLQYGFKEGILDFVISCIPEEYRIGEGISTVFTGIADNLGIGRIMHTAITPLINALIAVPHKQALNAQYTPTLLSEADYIHAQLAGAIDSKDVAKSAGYLGYKDAYWKALYTLNTRRATEAEIQLKWLWDKDSAEYATLMQKNQWLDGNAADFTLQQYERSQAMGVVRSWLNLAQSHFEYGDIDGSGLQAVLDQLPLAPLEKAWWVNYIQWRATVPRAQLSLAEVQKFYLAGLLDISDVDAAYTRMGYSQRDSLLLQYDLLLLGATDAEKAAAKVYAAQVRCLNARAKHAKDASYPLPPGCNDKGPLPTTS